MIHVKVLLCDGLHTVIMKPFVQISSLLLYNSTDCFVRVFSLKRTEMFSMVFPSGLIMSPPPYPQPH